MAARPPLGLVVALLSSGLVASACVGDLQPHNQVRELRVLGMRMDPPEARPGEVVTATHLVVDPTGASFTSTWYACHIPVDAGQYLTGGYDPALPFCDDPEHPLGDPIGTGDTVQLTVPETFLEDAAQVLAGAGLLGGDSKDGDATGADAGAKDELEGLVYFLGWHLRVTLIVERDDGTDRVEAHRRLLVTGLGGGHTNPDPPSLHMQLDAASREEGEGSVTEPPATTEPPAPGECLVPASEALTFVQDKSYLLVPVNLPEEYEEYTHITSTGELETLKEDYYFSWFSTTRGMSEALTRAGDPHVRYAVGTPEDEELLAADDGGRYLPIWVVVRDGRGGTAWCEQRVPYVESATD
jgi:hypothetical protein